MGEVEEGEIVDDEFEAISSDNTIPEPPGKSCSTNRRLRALSLSSVSEADLPKKCEKRRHRRRKRRKVANDSSDTDDGAQQHVKDNLKEKFKMAIHVNGGAEGANKKKKNSLQTRLRNMEYRSNEGESPGSAAEQEHGELATNDNTNKLPSRDKLEDSELENLRLEALRTAVMNKCMRRKKRKLEASQNATTEQLDNKENDEQVAVIKDAADNKKPCLEQNVEKTDELVPANNNNNNNRKTSTDFEEDEDILRASLLAAISKKITNTQLNVPKVTAKLPTKIVRPTNTIPNKQRIVNNQLIRNNVRQCHKIPHIKPLIITNDTSDSDDDNNKNTTKSQTHLKQLSSIDQFLKEQRAKVELNQQQNAVKSPGSLEKSVVKLLPKSQQIEYQQLLRKLKLAEKRKRLKKVTNLVLRNNVNTISVAQNSIETKLQNKSLSTTVSNGVVIRKSSSVSDLITLQKILKDINVQKNGRLQNQLKTQYQVLTPIIKKINAISGQRKKHESRIKNLEKELNETKRRLTKCYQDISPLIKELVVEKEKIDQSTNIVNSSPIVVNQPCTENKMKHQPIESTTTSQDDRKRIESITTATTTTTTSARLITSTPVNHLKNNVQFDDSSICCKEFENNEDIVDHVDIADPNDIDKIFKTRNHIPEYISPLNNCERYNNVDPLAIMCPYEVNGSCRDVDCTFKHYLKPV